MRVNVLQEMPDGRSPVGNRGAAKVVELKGSILERITMKSSRDEWRAKFGDG